MTTQKSSIRILIVVANHIMDYRLGSQARKTLVIGKSSAENI